MRTCAPALRSPLSLSLSLSLSRARALSLSLYCIYLSVHLVYRDAQELSFLEAEILSVQNSLSVQNIVCIKNKQVRGPTGAVLSGSCVFCRLW